MANRVRPLRDVLHYNFDRVMAMGWLAQAGLVLAVYAALVSAAAAFLVALQLHPEGVAALSVAESLWVSLVHALNSGIVARDQGWPFRAVMLMITLGGLFTTLTLTGIVTSAIGRKLQDLRRGRSMVLEEGHTLILGWTPAVFPILDELVKANAHRGGHRVVILAGRDQVDMEDAIRRHVVAPGRTRIICRTGSPIRHEDLAIVSPMGAKAIIILTPTEGGDPDVQVIRTILALVEAPDRKATPYHIVAEIRNPDRLEVARLVGKHEVELVAPAEVVPHLIVQTSLQPGLSSVYRALFRYEGSEVYFRNEPGAIGRPFAEVLMLYEDAAVMGLRHRDGTFTLLPAMDQRLAVGDSLITLAVTSEAFKLRAASATPIDEDAIHGLPLPSATARRVLVLGWSALGPAVVEKLDRYVLPGSEVCVVAPDERQRQVIEAMRTGLANLALDVRIGDGTDRRLLDSLDIPAFDHVVVLSPADVRLPEEADARTLVSLVQIRAIVAAHGAEVTIASEIHDDSHGDMAGLARADDFVVSDTLISMMLAQIAENKHLNAVFADLLNAQGAELALRPASHYVVVGREVKFGTVVKAVGGHGEVVLGYRHPGANRDTWQGVVLNPPKSAGVTFAAGDHLIVLTQGKIGSGGDLPALASPPGQTTAP